MVLRQHEQEEQIDTLVDRRLQVVRFSVEHLRHHVPRKRQQHDDRDDGGDSEVACDCRARTLRTQISPDIWKMLTEDSLLMHTVWELESHREHILAKRDVHIIRLLIEGMHSHMPEQKWQILGVRTIIESAEDDLRGLFTDAALIKKYGQLLRAAYDDYIPWYYKLFFFTNFKFVQDMAFPIAKENYPSLGRR